MATPNHTDARSETADRGGRFFVLQLGAATVCLRVLRCLATIIHTDARSETAGRGGRFFVLQLGAGTVCLPVLLFGWPPSITLTHALKQPIAADGFLCSILALGQSVSQCGHPHSH